MQWLVSDHFGHNRITQRTRILFTTYVFNDVLVRQSFILYSFLIEFAFFFQSLSKFETTGIPKVRVSDLFRSKNIRKISLVLYILWFSLYLVYYGLVLNLSNIGGNIYINTIISGNFNFKRIYVKELYIRKRDVQM